MDIKELLANIDNSVLTEESKAQICKVFESVLNEKVETQLKERVSIEVTKALEEQDESHASQLNELLEAIDVDHSNKLKQLVTKIDEDHTAKMNKIVEKYEELLSKEAKALTESLQNDISNFLDLALDDLLPKNMLKEAVNNTKATEKLKKIQEIVSVDEKFINDHIKEALEDGKNQIEGLRKDLNEVLKENVKLSAEKNKISADLVLERKTTSLPKEKKLFCEHTFKGKSASYIEENFEYALQMFERKEKDAIASEKVQVLNESLSKKIDTPKENRSNTENHGDFSYVSEYVSGLK